MLLCVRVCEDIMLHVYLSSETTLACGVGRQWIGACGRIFHDVNVLM